MKKIRRSSQLALALASLAMIGSFFTPLWRIDLWAPQYPEGLVMKIWLNRLSGDVEVINGLNHYIGMAHIKAEMFPEFNVLPYIAMFFIGFGLLTALLRSRRLLLTYLILMIAGGVIALADFYRWGYQYGHNLDANAPIKVPGMSYQPPVIGYKALLNFGAYSVPDIGGWLFILAGVVVAVLVGCEFYFCREKTPAVPAEAGKTVLSVVPVLLLSLLFTGCEAQTEPVQFGKESCHFCKMTIMDGRFAAELVTKKGKVFKFDDLSCLVKQVAQEKDGEAAFRHIVVCDFNQPGQWLGVHKAYFLKGGAFRSPMRGDAAAFATEDQAARSQGNTANTKALRWDEIKTTF